MLGDARLASQFSEAMLQRKPKHVTPLHCLNRFSVGGIYVIGFSYPVVPLGLARIRTQLSTAHSPEQIQATVKAFVEVGRELGVI